MLSGGSSPGSFCCMSLSLLLLLALLLLGVVHADGECTGFLPVLVLDQEGVLARVGLGDGGDGDAGELAVLVRELVVVVAQQLLLVLRPADLGHGVAPHVSSQVQGLKTGEKKRDHMMMMMMAVVMMMIMMAVPSPLGWQPHLVILL